DRINKETSVVLNGGELSFIAAAGGASLEEFGQITAGSNLSSTITSATNGVGSSVHLSFVGLTRGGGSTLNYVGIGDAITATGTNRVTFANAPQSLVNGVLPWSRLRGPSGEIDFVTLENASEGFAVAALPASGYVTDINQAGPTSIVRLAAGTHTLTTSRTISGLLLEDGAILEGNGLALTITNTSNQAGLILGDSSEINVSTLTLGNEGYITTVPGSQATINSTITGASTSITKAGTGKLVLTGDNQFSGAMNINAGTLNIQRSSALGATAGATNIRQEASLELEETTFGSVNVLVETINVAGTGIDDGGAIRNVAGNNSIAGNIALSGVTVDGATYFPSINSLTPSVTFINTVDGSLNLSGVISGNVELFKFGASQLE
ncbi:MAG: autotransporter-associated beta strand repeat-containing protein, partial [Verrucomicrobiae bacterium]|nr:autotransporter-associated beta strand repeat-containing protein [Verrucomicrobiae bacterium]